MLASHRPRGTDAVPLLTQALEQSVATGTAAFQALCRLSLGEAQLLAGRLEEGHTLAERTLALDPMQADAYGIFLVHYPVVLWIQYWLFDFDVPAIVKASVAFIGTTLISWGITWVLRQIPGVKRVM